MKNSDSRSGHSGLLILTGLALSLSFWLQPSFLSGFALTLLSYYYFSRIYRIKLPTAQENPTATPVVADCPEPVAVRPCAELIPESADNESEERLLSGGPQEAVLAFIQIDNLEDVQQGLNETQRTALQTETHRQLMEWANRFSGFLRKYSEDMYLGIFTRSELDRMTAEKFEVLDEVRSLRVGNKMPVTLSMGIAGTGKNMGERAQKAQTGLDLALGRGGDQVAVYVSEEVQFYGGKAKVMEKNTRVKARVIAHALREIMQDANEILIMGHEGEDFDCLGSALGVARMAAHLGKDVGIVIGDAGMSYEKLQELLVEYREYEGLFLTDRQARAKVSARTLLVVVDTHRVFLTAAPDLIDLIERRVVIDHHRRAEDFIPSPLLVYLEPSASSTSELVAELLTYFDEKIELTRLEASALYAGIVVDTKNFAVQTGVRTFEAAAFLRRSGADPTLVRHLFRVDMDTMRSRSLILSEARILPGGVVMSACPAEVKNGQIIAAQAADSLLGIEGVRVSFVLWPAEDGVGISARSNGEVNVQVIMEAFGGGGHQTVAGAHIEGVDLPEARRRLESVLAEHIGEEKEL